MNQRNYQRELDRLIERQDGRRSRLLLHSCCGPCSSSVLEYLTTFFDITLLWYNPNLYPEAEYALRLQTLRELLDKMDLADRVGIRIEPWQHEAFTERVRGLEEEPEGGKRCAVCFRLLLEKTARIAAQEGHDYFCTTLTLSRHKDAHLINRLGEEVGLAAGVRWLPSDFKKQGREARSVELSRQYGLYQQRYCGCEYSLRSRQEHDAAASGPFRPSEPPSGRV